VLTNSLNNVSLGIKVRSARREREAPTTTGRKINVMRNARRGVCGTAHISTPQDLHLGDPGEQRQVRPAPKRASWAQKTEWFGPWRLSRITGGRFSQRGGGRESGRVITWLRFELRMGGSASKFGNRAVGYWIAGHLRQLVAPSTRASTAQGLFSVDK